MNEFRHSMRELNDMLRPECDALFRELVPDAAQKGNRLIGHMPDGGKVSMALAGGRRGTWKNWHDGTDQQKGGPINLIQWVLFGGDRNKACIYARARLGLGDGHAPPVDLAARERQQRVAQRRIEEDWRARQHRVWRALDLWRGGRSDSAEVDAYLTHRLGGALPWRLRHLRFAADALDGQAAMLAPVVSLASAKQVATHVTLIAKDGAGVWRKADMPDAKRSYGVMENVAIPLLAGRGNTVLLAEGIENALAAAWLEIGQPRVWAIASLAGLASLHLPAGIETVIAVKDNDQRAPLIKQAWERAEARWLAQGRALEYRRAPAIHKDMAEFVVAERSKVR